MKEKIHFLYLLSLLTVLTLIVNTCTSIKSVPVESVKLDSVRIVDYKRDSVFVKDSVFVREKGDTVFLDRWRTVYRETTRVDTALVVRTDTIQKVVNVPRTLSKIEMLKMNIGTGVLWAAGIIGAVALFILFRKFLK